MVIGLIPSRLNSSRLEQKALLEIDGIPLIIHTMKRAKLSKLLDDVIVCTDSNKIKKIVEKFKGKAVLTKKKHKSGTDRIAEYAKKIPKAKIIIDIQGDDQMLNPSNIDKLIKFHKKNKFDIVCPTSPLFDPTSKNVVKIVASKQGKILYFSRAIVPCEFKKKNDFYLNHLSTISFNRNALIKFSKIKVSNLEKIEGIELLRAVENNISIGTFLIKEDHFSVDVKKDYLKAISLMHLDPTRKLY